MQQAIDKIDTLVLSMLYLKPLPCCIGQLNDSYVVFYENTAEIQELWQYYYTYPELSKKIFLALRKIAVGRFEQLLQFPLPIITPDTKADFTNSSNSQIFLYKNRLLHFVKS